MSAATAPASPRAARDSRTPEVHVAADRRAVPDRDIVVAHLDWSGASDPVAARPAVVAHADRSSPLRVPRLPADGRVLVLLLDPSPERARAVADALVDEETARAARARPGRGAKFTAVRGTLRVMLGRELGLSAREVPIVYGERGKPTLAPALGSDLHFNVSHTGGLAAIAVARGRAVGVDVELHRPRRRLDLLAKAALTRAERARFERLPEGERLAAFLDVWSAKEAYSKLLGRGLGLSFRGLELDAVRSTIVRLPVGPLHSGALAR